MYPHGQMRSRFGALLMIAVVLCGGCSPVGFGKYSGEFSVVNRSGRDVGVIRWEGFGFATPGEGNFVAESIGKSSSGKQNVFPPLESVPDFTIVTWGPLDPGKSFHEIDPAKLQKQRIDLRGVIPPGVAGTTTFILTTDDKWEVSFVPTNGQH